VLERFPELQKLHCEPPEADSRTVSRYLVSDTVLISLDEDVTEKRNGHRCLTVTSADAETFQMNHNFKYT
jgi:hypothetical protein